MIALFRNHYLSCFGIFCVGLFLFTVGLGHQEIVGFESRFYLFALEMWRHGPSGFPTTYGIPYPDYPATTTLFIYGVAKLLGHLDKLTAVLPSAIAASVTLVVTYSIGVLHSQRWGIFAVFFLLLTNTFVMEARTISPDQFVAMVTVLCFYLVYSATLARKTRRLGFIPLLFLFGFACRGPIGLVIPAGVVCLFYLCDRNFKLFFLMGCVAAVLLALGMAALFGMAYHVGGMPFVNEVWFTEVSGRLQDAHVPWYFYFTESFGAYAMTFPLAVCLAIGFVSQREHLNPRDQKFILKLFAWIAIIVIGLTIPAGKKIRYILAITPALALISAALFTLPQRQRYQMYLQKIVYVLCFYLPLICLVFITGAVNYVSRHSSPLSLNIVRNIEPSIWFAVFAFIILQCVMLAGKKRPLFVIGAASLTFVTFYILIIEPINLALNQGRVFVTLVEAVREQRQAKLVFYQENPDGTPIKYVVNMSREERPIFISTPETLAKLNSPAFFIVDPKNFAKLPLAILKTVHIVNTGSVGHNNLVVFEKNTAVP
jgi:4-amino-4-deoxy-L-arabinose transferase-like glycosyltransferase